MRWRNICRRGSRAPTQWRSRTVEARQLPAIQPHASVWAKQEVSQLRSGIIAGLQMNAFDTSRQSEPNKLICQLSVLREGETNRFDGITEPFLLGYEQSQWTAMLLPATFIFLRAQGFFRFFPLCLKIEVWPPGSGYARQSFVCPNECVRSNEAFAVVLCAKTSFSTSSLALSYGHVQVASTECSNTSCVRRSHTRTRCRTVRVRSPPLRREA